MKYSALIILISYSMISFGMSNDDDIEKKLNSYRDSINTLIANSSGAPGEVYTQTVNVQRNVRAIGVQETKITFYYIQKDDLTYMDNEEALQFVPQYNPPLMVLVQYNIGTGQSVTVKYYIDGENYLYSFRSAGDYGITDNTYWFGKNELKKYEERSGRDIMSVRIETGTFSKETYSDALLILDKIADYKKLYYDIFNIEYRDK